ncbi:hypothetical protein GALL_292390 [mine drainage metagenome]|uniref:Uncharacterized protein n=1 Tax=mine drainage metagenome TaxID=410659 RepID=A0A1J5R037_9ZZZZ
MTEQNAFQAFDLSLQSMLEAHRQHIAILTDDIRKAEAPRSRRALYNAIKAYRKAETALYHAATGEPPDTPLSPPDADAIPA